MIVIGLDGRERLEDDDYIVQSGEAIRTPMLFRDGAHSFSDEREKAHAEYVHWLNNAWKQDRDPAPQHQQQPQHQQPTRFSTRLKDEREQAYEEYCNYLTNAWRAGQ
jgi:hypothetical protein